MLFAILLLFTVNVVSAKRYDFNENKLGGDFRLVFFASESLNANKVSNDAFLLVDSLNAVFSSYNEQSEISELNRKGYLQEVSKYLNEVLFLSEEAYSNTNGSFDITVSPLLKLWGKAGQKGKLPKSRSLENTKENIGFSSVLQMNTKNGVTLKKGAEIDLGGIAKGYIIDRVYEFLKENNVPAFLVEAAGDIHVYGKPETDNLWLVGVSSNNYSVVTVGLKSGQAIATSGKTYRYNKIEGEKYSHIINPITGWPVHHNITSSVVSNSATTADYLASAFNVIESTSERLNILKNHKGAELLLLDESKVLFVTEEYPIIIK